MITLVRKELRALAPWIALVLILWGADLVLKPLSGWPDAEPFWSAQDFVPQEPDAHPIEMVVLFTLILSAALALVPGEIDRGRLEFLDALPVTRTEVFWGKAAACGIVFAVSPLMAVVEALLFHALSRESLDRSFHVAFLCTAVGLRLAQILAFISFSFLLAYLRRFAWLVVGLLYLALDLATQRGARLRLLDPVLLTEPAFEGQTWLVPWEALGVQGVLALASVSVAWWLFVRVRSPGEAAHGSERRGCLGTVLAAVAILLPLVILAVLLVRRVSWNDQELEPAAPLARAHTRHYTFSFPATLGRRAAAVAERSDAVYERVGQELGTAPIGRLVVDGTGIRSSAHVAGQASGRALRIDLPQLGVDEAARVLAHETAHAMASVLADGRLDSRLLSEGLATWVEERVAPDPAAAGGRRVRAAHMHLRRETDLEVLWNDDAVHRRFDHDVVYPLGEMFVEGAVSVCGSRVVGDFLRALGRRDRPDDLEGAEAWEEAFHHAGCDFERVIAAYVGGLERARETHRETLDRIPRLHATVARSPGRVGVTVRFDAGPPEHGVASCRFRPASSTPSEEYAYASVDEDGTCWTDRGHVTGGTLHYQLGYWEPALHGWLWQPWVEAPLRPR